MTRSDLLSYLLRNEQCSATKLSSNFDDWRDAMRGLVDLELVFAYRNGKGVTMFSVVRWRGME